VPLKVGCGMEAILFDLDDTLYDHLHGARSALQELARRNQVMQSVPIRELEDRYSIALEAVHLRLLSGELSQCQARITRMRQVFGSFGLQIDEDSALNEYQQFRQDYDRASQVVLGAHELLTRLRQMGVRLAIVTNNLVSEQIPKLQQLQLDSYFEVVTISEAVGVAKPDPYIFSYTLEQMSLQREQVIVVGDSLVSDIAGAKAADIGSVWLKRRADSPDVAPEGVGVIQRDFADIEAAIATFERVHGSK
jgi:putative hydrolase of the HAD superfamily